MTRLSNASWPNMIKFIETLTEAGMSAEDALSLTADTPLLRQFIDDVKQERLEAARLQRAESSPPAVAASGSPATLDQAFFSKGKFAYRSDDKSVRARVINTLVRLLIHKLRNSSELYITDLRHVSRSDVSDTRNMGEASMACLEQVMDEYDVAFADPLDPELVSIGTTPRLYYTRSQILDVEISRLVSSLGLPIDQEDVETSPTLGRYLRMEITARGDFCDERAQSELDEFVEQHDIVI